jgi:stromal membrane-associated protein
MSSLSDPQIVKLQKVLKKPENKYCADCERPNPSWASTTLGVFVCIKCSGYHRELGTHITKVKSCDLDKWTEEQMAKYFKISKTCYIKTL